MIKKIPLIAIVTALFISSGYASSVGTVLKIENSTNHVVTVVPDPGTNLLWENPMIGPNLTQSALAFENTVYEHCFTDGTHYSNNFSIVTKNTHETLCAVQAEVRIYYCAGDKVQNHHVNIENQNYGSYCDHRIKVEKGLTNDTVVLTIMVN